MTKIRYITIGELAASSGVSVRTLHYYDEIGLLVAERMTSGYRVYGPDHILRLQQILIQKSLGLSLAQIQSALDDPTFDTLRSLRAQRRVLEQRVEDTRAMIAAIDAALAQSSQIGKETMMNAKDIFRGFDPSEFEEETKTRWSDTDAYKTSAKRTGSYSDADWSKMKAEEVSIWESAVATMNAGYPADSSQAAECAHRHRAHIDHWFYPTTADSYAALADLWEADERFRQAIDGYGEGLTAWFAAAVRHTFGK